jgi:hypothetical protein
MNQEQPAYEAPRPSTHAGHAAYVLASMKVSDTLDELDRTVTSIWDLYEAGHYTAATKASDSACSQVEVLRVALILLNMKALIPLARAKKTLNHSGDVF